MTAGRIVAASLSAAALLIVGALYLTAPEPPAPAPAGVSVPTSTTPALPPCVVAGDCALNGRLHSPASPLFPATTRAPT